jgi:hypothetical protein
MSLKDRPKCGCNHSEKCMDNCDNCIDCCECIEYCAMCGKTIETCKQNGDCDRSRDKYAKAV